jgi:hypothetical protein
LKNEVFCVSIVKNKKFLVVLVLLVVLALPLVEARFFNWNLRDFLSRQRSTQPFNKPPEPPFIVGVRGGKVGATYTYHIEVEDTRFDRMTELEVLDGNGGSQTIQGDWSSGDWIQVKLSWDEPGDYFVKARVKDKRGEWSDWGERPVLMRHVPPPLPVKMECNIPEEGGRVGTEYTCTLFVNNTDYEGFAEAIFFFGALNHYKALSTPYRVEWDGTSDTIQMNHSWKTLGTFGVGASIDYFEGGNEDMFYPSEGTVVTINKLKKRESSENAWQRFWKRLRFW